MNIKNLESRIRKIDKTRDAKQLFAMWQRNAPEFRLRADYTRYLVEKPPSARPLAHLCEQFDESCMRAMKRQSYSDIENAIVRIRRDLVFLFSLYERVNDYLTSVAVDCGYRTEELRFKLLEVLQRNLLRSQVRAAYSYGNEKFTYPLGHGTASTVKAVPRSGAESWPIVSTRGAVNSLWATLDSQLRPLSDSETKKEAEDFHRSVAALMTKVYATKGAIDRINRKFFDGQLILWKEPVEWLESAIEVLESGLPRLIRVADSMACLYGPAAVPTPEVPRAEGIKATIDPQVTEECRGIVMPVKADLYGVFGEYQAQRDLLLPEIRRLMGEPKGDRPDAMTDGNSKKESPRGSHMEPINRA